jgi:hypothetical protein
MGAHLACFVADALAMKAGGDGVATMGATDKSKKKVTSLQPNLIR